MLGEGEWNNLGPGGLNKIGACPGGICKSVPGVGGRYHISLSRGGYILFLGEGGGELGGRRSGYVCNYCHCRGVWLNNEIAHCLLQHTKANWILQFLNGGYGPVVASAILSAGILLNFPVSSSSVLYKMAYEHYSQAMKHANISPWNGVIF